MATTKENSKGDDRRQSEAEDSASANHTISEPALPDRVPSPTSAMVSYLEATLRDSTDLTPDEGKVYFRPPPASVRRVHYCDPYGRAVYRFCRRIDIPLPDVSIASWGAHDHPTQIQEYTASGVLGGEVLTTLSFGAPYLARREWYRLACEHYAIQPDYQMQSPEATGSYAATLTPAVGSRSGVLFNPFSMISGPDIGSFVTITWKIESGQGGNILGALTWGTGGDDGPSGHIEMVYSSVILDTWFGINWVSTGSRTVRVNAVSDRLGWVSNANLAASPRITFSFSPAWTPAAAPSGPISVRTDGNSLAVAGFVGINGTVNASLVGNSDVNATIVNEPTQVVVVNTPEQLIPVTVRQPVPVFGAGDSFPGVQIDGATPVTVTLPQPLWTTDVQPEGEDGFAAAQQAGHNQSQHATNGNVDMAMLRAELADKLAAAEAATPALSYAPHSSGEAVGVTVVRCDDGSYRASQEKAAREQAVEEDDEDEFTPSGFQALKKKVAEKVRSLSPAAAQLRLEHVAHKPAHRLAARVLTDFLFSDDNFWKPIEGLEGEVDLGPAPKPSSTEALPVSVPKSPPKTKRPETKFDSDSGSPAARPLKPHKVEPVLQRIVAKLRANPADIADWVHTAQPSAPFLDLVSSRMWGQGWQSKIEMSTSQWFVYCRLCSVSTALMVLQCARTLPLDFMSGAWDELWGSVESGLTPTLSVKVMACEADKHNKLVHAENGNRRAVEAAAHNQLMHALNGNTNFVRSMDDVDEAKSTRSFYGVDRPTAPVYAPHEVITALSSRKGETNPNFKDLWRSTLIRSNATSFDNTLVRNITLPMPTAQTIPRKVAPLPDENAWVDSTQRLHQIAIGTIDYANDNLLGTELARKVTETDGATYFNIGAATQLTLTGFSASDVILWGRIPTFRGFNIDLWLLKLAVLHSIVAWRAPFNVLPLSSVSHIDTRTITRGVAPTLGFNNSPVFGEACTAAQIPRLPYGGGETGYVYFHVCLETVPIEFQSQAAAFPRSMGGSDPRPGLPHALFVHMLCEQPTGLATLTFPSTTVDNTYQEDVPHVLASSLIYMPGYRDVHIVLPRRGPSKVPTTREQARAAAQYPAWTGPAASVGPAGPIPANTMVDVNAKGQPLVGLPLTSYLATWATAIDTRSIMGMVRVLDSFAPTRGALAQAWDLIANSSVIFPVMTARHPDAAAGAAPPTDSPQQFSYAFASHVLAEKTTANWPQVAPPRESWFIYAPDVTAWNHVSLNLATVKIPASELSQPSTTWLSRPEAVTWLDASAMLFATVFGSHYANMGWDVNLWNTPYDNNNLAAIPENIRNHYGGQRATDALRPAPLGPVLAHFFGATMGRSPAQLERIGQWTSIFDLRTPPTAGYAHVAAVSATGLWSFNLDFVPQLLADVWMQYLSNDLPKWQKTFPAPGARPSIYGYSNDMEDSYITDTLIGPPIDACSWKPAMNQNGDRKDSDEMRWNQRLAYTLARAQPTSTVGQGKGLAPATFVFQRSFPVDPANTNPAVVDLIKNTFVWARVDVQGISYYAMSTDMPRIDAVLKATLRQAFLAASVWNIDGSLKLPTRSTVRSKTNDTFLGSLAATPLTIEAEKDSGDVQTATTPLQTLTPTPNSPVVSAEAPSS